jgi:hypothetical protein
MSTALTLYDLEDNLTAMLDTAEGGVDPALEQEFYLKLQADLAATKDKRDRVGQFLSHCDLMQANAKAEIERLQKLRTLYATAQERMEGYVIRVIQALGPDGKGKFRKLEGNTVSLSIQANPASVVFSDAAAVPIEHKKVTVKMPAETWQMVVDSLGIGESVELLAAAAVTEEVSKTSVKAALATAEVPGAALTGDTPETKTYRLVRK